MTPGELGPLSTLPRRRVSPRGKDHTCSPTGPPSCGISPIARAPSIANGSWAGQPDGEARDHGLGLGVYSVPVHDAPDVHIVDLGVRMQAIHHLYTSDVRYVYGLLRASLAAGPPPFPAEDHAASFRLRREPSIGRHVTLSISWTLWVYDYRTNIHHTL